MASNRMQAEAARLRAQEKFAKALPIFKRAEEIYCRVLCTSESRADRIQFFPGGKLEVCRCGDVCV